MLRKQVSNQPPPPYGHLPQIPTTERLIFIHSSQSEFGGGRVGADFGQDDKENIRTSKKASQTLPRLLETWEVICFDLHGRDFHLFQYLAERFDHVVRPRNIEKALLIIRHH